MRNPQIARTTDLQCTNLNIDLKVSIHIIIIWIYTQKVCQSIYDPKLCPYFSFVDLSKFLEYLDKRANSNRGKSHAKVPRRLGDPQNGSPPHHLADMQWMLCYGKLQKYYSSYSFDFMLYIYLLHIDTTEPVRTCSPLEFSVPDTSAQDFEDSETTRQNVLQSLHFETDNEDSETSLSDSSHIDIAAGLRNI